MKKKYYKTKFGKVKTLEDKPKGKLILPKDRTWTGVVGVSKEGKKITRIMTEKDAEEWAKDTGKGVYKKLTVGELRKL